MGKPKKPSFTLTAVQFEEVIGEGTWKRRDIPRSEWRYFPPGMVDKGVAFVISGTLNGNEQQTLNRITEAVGGLDWLRPETNPRPGEQEGNSYHFVFIKRGERYDAYGFKSETALGHDFSYEDLAKYFEDDESGL